MFTIYIIKYIVNQIVCNCINRFLSLSYIHGQHYFSWYFLQKNKVWSSIEYEMQKWLNNPYTYAFWKGTMSKMISKYFDCFRQKFTKFVCHWQPAIIPWKIFCSQLILKQTRQQEMKFVLITFILQCPRYCCWHLSFWASFLMNW